MSYIKPMFQIILFISLFLGVAGACMAMSSFNPFKKEVVLMSPLKGQVLKSKKPLSNIDITVEILLANGDKQFYKYETDENGFFELPIIKDEMVLGPMSEFAVSQFVSVIYEGESVEIWYAGKRNEKLYGELISEGEIIGLSCDIENSDYNEEAEKHGSILTICTWDKIRKFKHGNSDTSSSS